MENQQSNSGRSSGFTFLRAPSHFLFSKMRKQWLKAQRVITTTRCRRSQKKAYSSGTARDSHPFPFSHVSIHANGRGHLRDRVSPAKVIMKKNKAKGFDGFLAIGQALLDQFRKTKLGVRSHTSRLSSQQPQAALKQGAAGSLETRKPLASVESRSQSDR